MVKLAHWKWSGAALGTGLQLAQQLRQLGDVGRNPPCLIFREQLGSRSPARHDSSPPNRLSAAL